MYYLIKIAEFLQVRGTIALITSLLLLGALVYTDSIIKDNKKKDIKIAEYSAVIASYKSVVSNDVAVVKAQSSECANLVKEQVKAALDAKPVDKKDEQFFKIDGLIK